MENIKTVEELENAIRFLERKKEFQKNKIQEHFLEIIESMKPINVIKDTFSEMLTSQELRSNLSKIAVGALSGYIAKEAIMGETKTPVSKIMGIILETVVAKNVMKNSDKMKAMGQTLLKRILNSFSE